MKGGRYTRVDGTLIQVEEPTQAHPSGNAPRDEQGCRLDRPGEPESGLAFAAVTPKKKGGRNAA